MPDQLLLPDKDTPLKRAWKTWKGVGLAFYLLALLLSRWLPAMIVVVCYLVGVGIIINLIFHFLRYIKNRVFWRVRYRIVGSFVFVGLLPLLLIIGIVYLSAYMLMGQLSASYLRSSLDALLHEISWINVDLSQGLHPPASEEILRAAAGPVLKKYASQFPSLAVILMRRKPDGSFEVMHRYDPKEITEDPQKYLPEKSLGDKVPFEGLIQQETSGWLITLRPTASLPGYFLEVRAPIDQHIEDRLRNEKDIYVVFSEFGHTSLRKTSSGVQITIGDENDKKSSANFELQVGNLESRRKSDKRRMTTWGAVLECWDYATGVKKPAALAVLHVPFQTLYGVYFSGSSELGKALLAIIATLLVIFVLAELVSVVIGATISRRITRSVHDMYLGTLALQKADLQYRIPVRRNDQLGLLAQSFNQMGASITRLLEEVSEKKRLEQELEIAREVQATLFPKQLPHQRGLSIFGGCEPARVVSGDYYDFIHEDDARLHIVVGDISGKGISAALLMANLQAAMRSQLSTFLHAFPGDVELSLARVMSQLNTQIFLNSPTEKYATLFAGRYDAEARRLCYCNAGHLPPILLQKNEIRRLEAGGTVLGLFQEATFEASSVDLAMGTVIAIFTDGITEAVNSSDEEFGEERLIEALRESVSRSPEAIYRHVTAQVRMWQGSLKQHDDITLIIGKVE